MKWSWDQAFTASQKSDAYFQALVRDLARWSEGKPIRFVSEQDGLIERWQDAQPLASCPTFPPVTGDRYSVHRMLADVSAPIVDSDPGDEQS